MIKNSFKKRVHLRWTDKLSLHNVRTGQITYKKFSILKRYEEKR